MRVLVWEVLNSTSMRYLRIVFWANFNQWKNTQQYSQIPYFLDYRVQNVPELVQKLVWLVAFQKRPALLSAMLKISCILNSSKDNFIKKSLPLWTWRKLIILLKFSFRSVCFRGVFLALKCETLVLFTIAIELSHFWGFLARSHIFTRTMWPETLWPRGIMRPRD